MEKSSNKGFTLVELIIVIAILAIIMLIAIPNFSGIQQRMQVRADKSSAAQIGKAVRIWYTEYTSDGAFKNAVDNADGNVDVKAGVGTVGTGDKATQYVSYTKGSVPIQGTNTVAVSPIASIAKLDEYLDVNLTPSSLRNSDKGVVEPNQYYYTGIVGTGTAEKIVVCIANKTAPLMPASSSTDEVEVGYTGDHYAEPTFNQTVAYKEP